MAKKAVSVTLDAANVLWLKGRARVSGGNVSEALDQLITKARTGQSGPHASPASVVGLVDLSDDPDLSKADAAVREMFDASLGRCLVHENPARVTASRKKRKTRG
jgi:hypothetical protein